MAPNHYLNLWKSISYCAIGNNFSKIRIKVNLFSFYIIKLKMLSGKWQPFCLLLDVFRKILSRSPNDSVGSHETICRKLPWFISLLQHRNSGNREVIHQSRLAYRYGHVLIIVNSDIYVVNEGLTWTKHSSLFLKMLIYIWRDLKAKKSILIFLNLRCIHTSMMRNDMY